MNFFLYLFIALIFFHPANAQDKDVEINLYVLDQLDRVYETKEQSSAPNTIIMKPMYERKTTQDEMNPANDKTSKKVEQKNEPEKPPLPEKRPKPQIRKVGEKRIQKAQVSNTPTLPLHNDEANINQEEIDVQSLSNPNIMDILESIDPEAAQGERKHKPKTENFKAYDPLLISLGYKLGVTNLPGSILDSLKHKMLDAQDQCPQCRIEIISYAQALENFSATAIEISRLRVEEVNQAIISMGIDPSKISVFALGNSAPSGPKDRTDIKFMP